MGRKNILSSDENGSFFDKLSSAVDTTLSQVNVTTELSRNFNQVKQETTFFQDELDMLIRSDDIFTETSALYEDVKNNPINVDIIENRLLALRAELVSINENPVLVKKGLQPFVPVRLVTLSDSSYLSPFPTNRSQQSIHNSFPSAKEKSRKTSLIFTPNVTRQPLQNAQVTQVTEKIAFDPDSYDSPLPTKQSHIPAKFNLATSVKKSARKLTQDNDENCPPSMEIGQFTKIDTNVEQSKEQESAFKPNISDPELNRVMARLAAWKTKNG